MSLIDDAHKGMQAANLPYAPPAPGMNPGYLPAAPPPPESFRCRSCGAVPAAYAEFHSNRGFIVYRQSTNYVGPYCRDCGIATFRKASAINLIAGWWGYISVFVTPVYLIMNAVARRKVAKLPAPQYPAPGYSPLPVGRPLLLRWQAIGLLLPALLIAVIIGAILSPSTPSASDDSNDIGIPTVGSCVHTISETRYEFVNCSATHDGKISTVVTNTDNCPADTMYWTTAVQPANSFYCIASD